MIRLYYERAYFITEVSVGGGGWGMEGVRERGSTWRRREKYTTYVFAI